MVEGTRLKVMDDKLVRHEEVLNEVVTTQETLRNTQTGIQGTLELILERLTNLERVPQRAQGERPQGDGLLPMPGQEMRQLRPQTVQTPAPKWELPYFEGHEPKGWIRKCERYFNLYKTPENLKVEAAALYLNGLADARLQEKAIEAALKCTKTMAKSFQNTISSSINKAPVTTTVKPTSFRLSPEVYEYRKNNHLCYKCGEKYAPGHQCKKKQLNSMIGAAKVPIENAEIEEEQDSTGLIIEGDMEQEVIEAVCLNALSGDNKGVNIILVRGTIGNRKLTVLIDSGSTHSFIDATTVKESGFQAQPCPPVRVTVADGNYVMCIAICMKYQWKMQGRPFQENLFIIPLGGCNMVMGNDWMKKHNPTTFDHEKMCVTIGKKGNKLVLQGITEEGKLTMITSGTMGKMLRKGQALLAHLFMMNAVNAGEQEAVGEAIEEVLQQYSDVFAEPKTLPPVRSLDHSIPLKPGAIPISLRPYRYNYYQKEELERQVKEMLTNGIIQHSQSPFSSPALLVKKKDGSWRFCVDYRGLNDITIKDKYPIPIVDDLLDELSGSMMFSKVDLRAGYHQIRMKVEDVYKTAFRTHMGHYEFRVMPFGLTNAPATFQALMNQVFQPFLRKFVLVFFDDILVYSLSEKEHVAHLSAVFDILRKHSLFAKRSKCSFGQSKVEYLGHIITVEGVSTDPSKIKAMTDWPTPNSVKALRGFLGLTGYYRKYVANYGTICRPLTELLRKDAFKWDGEADLAFEKLKKPMFSTPVLALPDYSKDFIVETDASQMVIGAVLMQEGRPIAYF
ncbi:PREDICTED: uncharacterized protein LOC109211833 [Nicotiana attenuata]|uniref:uncharacterized protein LOC109211833 n=1 Tax=Nicotiana attenuata TaxID=49451 RepID=UPI000904611A|nr:PREDICTED: uncharacterized protein LOC109211833 [Nicotiana attenuata]